MLDLIPPNAIMYLVNAIYFDARWKYAFDKEQTAPGTFYLAGGGTQQADFMKVNGGFSFAHHNDFTAVELPYGDSTFSMVVMLPDAGKTVSELVDQMDADTWDSWFDDSRFTNVQVEMPKFTYGFKDSLNEPLIQLGLGVAFDPFKADFSGICPGRDLYISRVIHQSFIDVKEEGTEAAAATIVEIREFTSSIPGPVVFRLDRPFLYLIKENSTGAILFMGSVGKPEYSG